MICKVCGKELDETAAFCTECGTAVVQEAPVENAGKKKAKLDFNTIRLILGSAIIFIGVVRLLSSSVSIGSTSFGADFYTYAYKGIVACANMLGKINATISWALISFGAYIDLKSIKEMLEKK